MAIFDLVHNVLRKHTFLVPIIDSLGLQFLKEDSSLLQIVPVIIRLVALIIYVLQAILGYVYIYLYGNFNSVSRFFSGEMLLPVVGPSIGIVSVLANTGSILAVACATMIFTGMWQVHSVLLATLYSIGTTDNPFLPQSVKHYAWATVIYGGITILMPIIGMIVSVVLIIVRDIFMRLDEAGIKSALLDSLGRTTTSEVDDIGVPTRSPPGAPAGEY